MVRNYVYRVDHDIGFAPNVDQAICTLSGCKTNTVERWAKKGSWVIGIGGKKTGKSDKLIYVMEVDKNLLFEDFKRIYPIRSRYLSPENAGTNVLISKKFYYFGDQAIDLPQDLRHIIWDRQGCKGVSDEDAQRLKGFLSKRYRPGKLGNHNNPRT